MAQTTLVPHTTPWFEALLRTNPRQAMQISAVIKATGRLDVCGICGDDPASDYELTSKADPDAVLTLRLCSDCLKIRTMSGERFQPLQHAEFRIIHFDEDEMQVEDVAEGHRWTFCFAVNGQGERMLSMAKLRSESPARATDLTKRALNFAEAEAGKASKIDRSVFP